MSDDEIRRFIQDAFAVARENDAAVALHIDDSMSWGKLSGLTKEKKFVGADSLADELLVQGTGWSVKTCKSARRKRSWNDRGPRRFWML